jgi:hypothetical protein
MYQSRYTKSKVTNFMESAGIKKSNMPHVSIPPINYVLTSNDLATTRDESSAMQEAHSLDWIACIGSLIYLSYIIPYISFTVNKLATYSIQPWEKHTTVLIHLLN